jgi:hypothetical protein
LAQQNQEAIAEQDEAVPPMAERYNAEILVFSAIGGTSANVTSE